MKTIKLKKLTLQDWRAQNKIVEFTDNTEIRGYNKSGKSSIYNAFLWLLTGADDMDRNNYNLFDNTIQQTYDTSKIASVEGVFEIDDIEYTFKRTAEIGWTRKRGNDDYERKGSDNYKFYIDGIERNSTEYKKSIEELFAPIEKLKIMLNLQYFLRLDWKEMRKQLEDMVGEITISDFKGDYSDILNDLKKYSPEEVKVSYKAKMKPIKQSIETLPIAIETLKSSLPDINGLEEVQREIDRINNEIKQIDDELIGISEKNNESLKKRDEELSAIRKLKSEFSEKESEYKMDYSRRKREFLSKIQSVDEQNRIIKSTNKSSLENFENAKRLIASEKETLKRLEEYRLELLKRNEEVKSMKFSDDKCAYCGQTLPEDKMEEAKAKFNESKEARHKSIVAEGKSNNLKIQQCKKNIESMQAIIDNGYEEKELIDKNGLLCELDELEDSFVEYEKTEEGSKLMETILKLSDNLTPIDNANSEDLIERKNELMASCKELFMRLGLKDEYEKQMSIIQNKQKELKDSSVELARLEGLLNKVNAYEREKAQIVSDRVNGRFDYIQVQMTEVNKSGDFVDTCRILDADGVNASVTNFASQVRCGIDISTAFCKFYGVNIPMFIDFAESICEDNYPETDRQTIKLIVDECNFNVTNK